MPKAKAEKHIYQLKVTLKYSKPPIWRRLLVASDTTLAKLHDILQITMGWEDAHLHHFKIGEVYYSKPMTMFDMEDLDNEDSHKVKLSQIVTGEKFKFLYEYDFGDSWYHEIVVEKILPHDSQQPLPRCITGKLACPPEDIGGIGRYYWVLEVLEHREDPEYEDLLEWLGGDFDPDAFDMDAINQELSRLS